MRKSRDAILFGILSGNRTLTGPRARKGEAMNRRLINETAFNMTRTLLGMIAHNLHEEEHRDIFEEFFGVCQAGLEAYCLQDKRMQHQLHPMGGNDVRTTAAE
jgi:hypothetical protein